MKPINPNILSFSTVPISMVLKETEVCLGRATSFFYFLNEKYYLITNWHNVTGLNPTTKKQLGNTAGIPDAIDFFLMVENNSFEEEKAIAWKNFRLNLYDGDFKAVWLVHPDHKELVDVIAIECTFPNNFNGLIKPINNFAFDKFKLEVADEVYVLGYPFALTGGGQFPIWKKGSIATEPDIPMEGLPRFYIDTATRRGMSGSPVIARRYSFFEMDMNGEFELSSVLGRLECFAGIYSGRIGENEIEAQLGYVWNKEVIDEIILGGLKDTLIF